MKRGGAIRGEIHLVWRSSSFQVASGAIGAWPCMASYRSTICSEFTQPKKELSRVGWLVIAHRRLPVGSNPNGLLSLETEYSKV